MCLISLIRRKGGMVPGFAFEVRRGVRTRNISVVRAKISYHLDHDLGVSRAEIARQLGVCTSAIAKAIQNVEIDGNKC